LPTNSLIICSRNRPKLLTEVVDSVLKGNEVPTELVIIDQSDVEHPSLGSFKTERDCELRYLWSPDAGLGRARNTGIAAARYELIAFTDDDIVVTSNWYGTLIRALVKGGPRSVISGQVLAAEAEVQGGYAPSTMTEEAPAIYQGRINKDVLLAGNMAMYRQTVKEIGFFDERLGAGARFPSAEDNDFGFRLLEAGYRIMYVPEAVLYHRAWRAQGALVKLRWNYGIGRGAFYAKHLHLKDHYMLRRMYADVKTHLTIFLKRERGERSLVLGDAAIAFGILFGAAKWLITQPKKKII
jgi:GT2 family glycosyltransferase